jgi:hypothetical protein
MCLDLAVDARREAARVEGAVLRETYVLIAEQWETMAASLSGQCEPRPAS